MKELTKLIADDMKPALGGNRARSDCICDSKGEKLRGR